MIEWLEHHMLPCLSKKYFGMECPGCGMQRSFIELLKGNFQESFLLYPPLLPVLAMVIFLFIQLRFRFVNGGKYLLWLFSFNAAIIMINYFARLILSNI